MLGSYFLALRGKTHTGSSVSFFGPPFQIHQCHPVRRNAEEENTEDTSYHEHIDIAGDHAQI